MKICIWYCTLSVYLIIFCHVPLKVDQHSLVDFESWDSGLWIWRKSKLGVMSTIEREQNVWFSSQTQKQKIVLKPHFSMKGICWVYLDLFAVVNKVCVQAKIAGVTIDFERWCLVNSSSFCISSFLDTMKTLSKMRLVWLAPFLMRIYRV